jgi:adenylate kinase
VATGDIFRANIESDTPLGRQARAYVEKGELVPDPVVVRMVLDRLAEDDAREGFILDGFPRTLGQAEALEAALDAQGRPLSAVLGFDLSDETAVKRLAGRRTCARCQRTYNVEEGPTRVPGVCDACGGELVQRADDEEETVRRRLEVYHRQTEPLEAFYRQRGLLREVDADGTEDEVTDRAVRALAGAEEPAGEGR